MDYRKLITRTISSICIVLTILLYFYYFENQILYLVIIIYGLIFLELINNFKKNKYLLIIAFYLILSFLSIYFYLLHYYNYYEILLLATIIITFDTFAYIFGSIFGRNKIFISISKNKTYEGVIYGLIFAFIISSLLNIYLEIFDYIKYILFFLPVVFFSFFGDLIESFFKRKSNIKDSSNFIPGHGGFFDRFDSFIFTFYYLLIFNIIF